jgi:hypothetical protein
LAGSAYLLLQQIIDYPVDENNIDALRLQILAAKALLILTTRDPPPTAKTMGGNGGHARAKALSPERRHEIAKKAAQTRWKI